MKSVNIFRMREDGLNLDSYDVNVGDIFYAIGVRRQQGNNTSELGSWLETLRDSVKVVAQFPETPNFNYLDNTEEHMLQPVVLKRIK